METNNTILRACLSFVGSIIRLIIRSTVFLPSVLYRKSRACRMFARQLRKQGVPDAVIHELTKCYREQISFHSWKTPGD